VKSRINRGRKELARQILRTREDEAREASRRAHEFEGPDTSGTPS
jgi:hypothetical protein